MHKVDLIKALRDSDAGLSKTDAERIVNIFFHALASALASGDRVEIRGFCTFYIKEYGSYTGRNPKTGERLIVAPKKMPFFKAGKELKKRLNNI